MTKMIVEEWMAKKFIEKFGKKRWHDTTKPLFPGQKNSPFTPEESSFWEEIYEQSKSE